MSRLKLRFRRLMGAGFIVGVLAASIPAIGQALRYTTLESPEKPSARVDGTIAYDGTARRLYLFGGQDISARNDLWSYSLADQRWEQINAMGTLPPPRFGHTLIFDPVRRQLVVFGGQASGFFSDVWAFSIASQSWRQLSRDEAGPSRRYGHSAILEEARGRMIISHGFTDAGRFDDTWAFDLASNAWQNISPSGTRPLRRCLHRAVYNGPGNEMLLYGGCASGFGPCPLGDLWSFDLINNRWTERTSQPRPASRQYNGMSFDTGGSRAILFAGSGSGLLNDTWEFDVRASQWREVTIEGTRPAGRTRLEAAYAPDQRVTFFFGGSTATGSTNELLMLAPAAPSPAPAIAPSGVLNAFSGTGGGIAPGEIVSIFGASLGPASGATFAFDAQSGRLPTSGAGVEVTINGVPAPLYFVRADQLNVQVPYEVRGPADARLVVTVNGRPSDAVILLVASTRLGLHRSTWNQDGTINSRENPAAADSVIVLYATGQGVTVPESRTGEAPSSSIFPVPAAALSVRVGGRAAEILFRGQAPGTAGVMQLNVRVPEGVSAAGSSPLPVVVESGDSSSNTEVFVRTP